MTTRNHALFPPFRPLGWVLTLAVLPCAVSCYTGLAEGVWVGDLGTSSTGGDPTLTSASASDTTPVPTTGSDVPTTDAGTTTGAVVETTGELDTTSDDVTTDTTTTDATTTDATTDDATTGTTAPEQPACGNGLPDPGEECDWGNGNNANDKGCTLECKYNVCGDGKVHVGVEACDDGIHNNNAKYGGCQLDCKLGPHCGDGILQPEEECDAGDYNGTNEHNDDAVACALGCKFDAKIAFLSSKSYFGQLGGIAGADEACQHLAEQAGLDNHAAFRAWLSSDTQSPASTFVFDDLPLVQLNGVRVADNMTHLMTAGPKYGIVVTENGAVEYNVPVWTGTNPQGQLADATTTCVDWTYGKADVSGLVGLSGVDPQNVAAWNQWKGLGYWTQLMTTPCNQAANRLYCLEQ